MKRTRTFLAVTGVLGALALAACGPATSATPVAQVDRYTAMSNDAKGSLQKVADAAAKLPGVTLQFADTGSKSNSGTVSFSFAPYALDVTLKDGGDDMSFRVIGPTVYIKVPAKDSAEMMHKSWMKLGATDLGKNGSDFKDMDAALKGLEAISPTNLVKALIVSKDVKGYGTADINGVKAVHFSGRAAIADYLPTLPPNVREFMKKSAADDKADTIAVEIWVDANYQILRMREGVGSDQSQIDVKNAGKPVKIVPPPAAETLDLSALLGAVGKS